MSRLNLNSILSWVDSHIIDYPTAMKKVKKARMFILVFFVSLFLLFFVSPVLGTLFLMLFTLYFLYNKKYKGTLLIWGNFFLIWYLVFTACLIGYDGPILITPDFVDVQNSESRRLLSFIEDRYSSFSFPHSLVYGNLERFCMDTFGLLLIISFELKVTIYIPSFLKAILGLFKFIWGGKGGPSVECSPEKNSPHDSPPSPSTPFPSSKNNWGTKPSWNDYSSDTEGKEKTPKTSEEFKFGSPTPSPKSKLKSVFGNPKIFAPDECNELRKRMQQTKRWYDFYNIEKCVVDGRSISYSEFGIWNKTSVCANSRASADEIIKEKLFREFKRNEKK